MQPTALVTGATGFVGSRLVTRLVTDGWAVHVIVRPESNLREIGAYLQSIELHAHDGTTETMMAILKLARPDVVFHLASRVLVQHQSVDVKSIVESNVTFGAQLVEAMIAGGVHRLVNTGTSWQHYENRDFSPVNLYAATKQAFEAILQYYVETTPLRVVTLKLNDTYGPDDPRPKLFALLRRAAETGEVLKMSPGEQRLDLVFIDDVVEAFLAAAKLLQEGNFAGHERYAVSSGDSISLRDFVTAYESVLGSKIPIEWGGRSYRPREMMQPWSGEVVPGWRPKTSLAEGIRKTLSASEPHLNQKVTRG